MKQLIPFLILFLFILPCFANDKWGFQADETIASAPVIVEDNVIFGTYSGTIYSVDARTGNENWRYVLGGLIEANPSVDENSVIFGNREGIVVALNKFTGAKLWEFKAHERITERTGVVEVKREIRGIQSDGNSAYVSTVGKLYRLGDGNATVKWSA